MRQVVTRLRIRAIMICAASALVTLTAFGVASASTQNSVPWPRTFAAVGRADMPVADNNQGLLHNNMMEINGPGQQTSFGDPYTDLWDGSVVNPYYNELSGAYTYRIAIPPNYPYHKVRVELFDPVTGDTPTLPGTIWRTDGTSTTTGIACGARQDPCTLSTTDPSNPFWFVRLDEYRGKGSNPDYDYVSNTRTLFRLYYYVEPTAIGREVPVDLAYYIGKKDDPSQNRPSQGSWQAAQSAAAAQAEAAATMMQWVTPGAPANERMPAFSAGQIPYADNGVPVLYDTPAEPATVTESCQDIHNANGTGNSIRLPIVASYPAGISPTSVAPSNIPCSGDGDFVVDLTTETPGLYTDPYTGMRYLNLDVIGFDGTAENNFQVWAGPAVSEDPDAAAPSDINARQLYILRENNAAANPHLVHTGLDVYGVGYLPRNNITSSRMRMPIARLGPEYAGQTISVMLFDMDAGTVSPLVFYIDGIPQNTWQACFTSGSITCATDMGGGPGGSLGPDNLGTNDAWATYTFTIPTAADPANFTGGTLMAYVQDGITDTYQFKIIQAAGTPAPAAPVLSAPADGATVSAPTAFSWSAPANAYAYEFEYASDSNFSQVIPNAFYDSVDLFGTSIIPNVLQPGAVYWRVRARRVLGAWGAWSAVRTLTFDMPTPPLMYDPTVQGRTQIDLAWEDISTGATGYKIERAPAGSGDWAQIAIADPGVTTYSDTSAHCHTTYDYRATTLTAAGSSSPSIVVSATTDACLGPHTAVTPSAAVTFDPTPVTQASSPITLTLHNTGDQDLHVDPLAQTGSTDFAMTADTCSGQTVSGGGACTFTVTFSPTANGHIVGEIHITSDSPSSPDLVGLEGDGLPPGPPPTLISPANGAAIALHTPRLSWKAQDGATGYHILLSDLLHLTQVADQDVATPYFVTPVLDFGSYSWQVKSQYPTGWSIDGLPRTFDVTISKKPGRNEAVGTHLPTFSWQKVKGATGYHLEIYAAADDCQNGVTSSALFQKDTAKTSYHLAAPDPSLAFGQYYWRVAATRGVTTSFMPCWPFSVTSLKTPRPGSVSTSLLPKFSWLGSRAASGYQINVSQIPSGGAPVPLFSRTTTAPHYTAVSADGFAYGRYKWTVQEDLGGALGIETPAFTFDLTTMLTPVDKSFLLDSTPTFKWKKVKGASDYELQISSDALFIDVFYGQETGTATSATLPDPAALPQGVYYWRIVAQPGDITMPGWSITIGP